LSAEDPGEHQATEDGKRELNVNSDRGRLAHRGHRACCFRQYATLSHPAPHARGHVLAGKAGPDHGSEHREKGEEPPANRREPYKLVPTGRPLKKGCHLLRQEIRVIRFGDVANAPSVEAQLPVAGHGMRRDRDHWD
jgi:hypothetical protein